MVSNDSGWIKLNVGGKPFLTTLTTLESCPDSLLAKMFDPGSGLEPAYKENGVYFLDTNPKYFGIILDWLRYKQIIADADTDLDNVAKIADYFGLEELVEAIKAPDGKWENYGDMFTGYNDVPAMLMKVKLGRDEALTRIVQLRDGLKFVKEDKVPKSGAMCLSLERHLLKSAVWVPTTTGRVPHGALAVKGEIRVGENGELQWRENMFVGRRLWNKDSGMYNCSGMYKAVVQDTHKYEGGIITIEKQEIDTYISVGYVTENGIFVPNFTSTVNDVIYDNVVVDGYHCNASEFEILCIV